MADDLERSIALIQVELARSQFLDEEVRQNYMRELHLAGERQSALRNLNSEDAVVAGAEALRQLGKFVSGVPATLRKREVDQENIATWSAIAARLELEVRGWSRVEHLVNIQRAAESARRKADDAADESERAAGKSGNAGLEAAFEKYANDERKIANRFRTSTIVMLSVVIALATGVLVESLLVRSNPNFVWQEVVYRVAILTAIAGMAAYLGRQSGQHRRTSVWAEAVAVQLRSFPSFIKPIDNAKLSDSIYEAFGRRVLAAPPDFSGKSDDSLNPMLAILVDALVKQSRPTP